MKDYYYEETNSFYNYDLKKHKPKNVTEFLVMKEIEKSFKSADKPNNSDKYEIPEGF